MTVATFLLFYDFVFNPSSIFPGLALIFVIFSPQMFFSGSIFVIFCDICDKYELFPGLALICLTTSLVVFNYFQHVCAVAVMLLLTFPLPYFLACTILDNLPGFEQFSVFAFSCWTLVLVAFFYVHNIWVEPSRQMLLGLQQVDVKM